MARSFFKKIPKNIFMAWDGVAPEWARKTFERVTQMNPGYSCTFFNSLEVKDKSFPLYEYQDYSDKKFFKADVFRYYILYTYGGIWLDCDILEFKPFDNYVLKNDNFVVKSIPRVNENEYEINNDSLVPGLQYINDNYFMGCEKKSKFILEIIKRFKELIKKGEEPSAYDLAIFKLFNNFDINSYATSFSLRLSEEGNENECDLFFNQLDFDSITPFNNTSYLKHFRNNAR